MASISLRAYDRLIQEMIDHDRNDDAWIHCRHILEKYPKQVSTYRLLGQVYLEKQNYRGAEDVFHRLLSCIPDDFFAHAGLSIVKEEQGELEAAIWHMERAYEIQPSNPAIQVELKRLYKQRDGEEPTRIHLTRGALSRMYFKGDLYDQAVTEIHKALAAEPERTDLQVLLAHVYYSAGRYSEAVETSNALLQLLPNCFVANQIMAQVLTKSEDRYEEAKIYRDRITEINPYAAFTKEDVFSLHQVPADTISIEKLVLSTDEEPEEDIYDLKLPPISTQRDQGFETELDELPDWVSESGEDEEILAIPEQKNGLDETFTDGLPKPSFAEEDLPWESETSDIATLDVEPIVTEEQIKEFEFDIQDEEGTDETVGDEISTAFLSEEEVPWEKEAPEIESVADEFIIPEEMEPVIDDFPEIEPVEANSKTIPLGEIEDEAMMVDEGNEEEIEGLAEADIPDWIRALAPGKEGKGKKSESSFEQEDIPSWLETSAPGASDTIIAWLGEHKTEDTPPTTVKKETKFDEKIVRPDQESSEEPVKTSPQEPASEGKRGALAWLDEVAKEQAKKESIPSEPDSTGEGDEKPDWLVDFDELATAELKETKEEEIEISDLDRLEFDEEASDQEVQPDWLEELVEKQARDDTGALFYGPSEISGDSELPDWLEMDVEIPTEERIDEEELEEDIPDWLHPDTQEEDIEIEEPPAKEPDWIAGEIIEEDIEIKEPPAEQPDWIAGEIIEEDELKRLSEIEEPELHIPEVIEPVFDVEPEIQKTPDVSVMEIIEESGALEEPMGDLEPEPIVTVESAQTKAVEIEFEYQEEEPSDESKRELVAFDETSVTKRLESEVEILVEAPTKEIIQEAVVPEEPAQSKESGYKTEIQEDPHIAVFNIMRLKLKSGDHGIALKKYQTFIGQGQFLDEIIQDLRNFNDETPEICESWELLGDALMRSDQLDDAMQAYLKAQDLLQ